MTNIGSGILEVAYELSIGTLDDLELLNCSYRNFEWFRRCVQKRRFSTFITYAKISRKQ